MRRSIGVLAVLAVLATACEPMGPAEERPADSRDIVGLDTPGLDTLGLDTLGLGIGGAERRDAELTFARLAPGVEPGLLEVSFLAVKGQTSTVAVPYLNQDANAPPLLEFEVGANSLVNLPNGDSLLPGDTVRITVVVDPLRRFIFGFQPHGLTFSQSDPARLRVNYAGADPDVNGDGVVDQHDGALQNRSRIWQRELPGLPWRSLPTRRLPGDVVEGKVTHFTGFAFAS